MFEGLTEKSIQVILLAQEEARRLGYSLVDTEQLLLGLIRGGTGVTATVLKSMGIRDISLVRSQVEKMIQLGPGDVPAEIPLADRAERVLELAQEEARQLGQAQADVPHLLLGLIRDKESVAYKVLKSLDVEPLEVRVQILTLLKEAAQDRAAASPANQGHGSQERASSEPPTESHTPIDPSVERLLDGREDWETELSNVRAQVRSVLDAIAYQGGVNPSLRNTLAEYALKLELFCALLTYSLLEARDLLIQVKSKLGESPLAGGDVLNALIQLPSASAADQPDLRELLLQLQGAIESDANLSGADKSEALEQVKILAEMGQNPAEPRRQQVARTAIKILRGTVAELPGESTFGLVCDRVLPVLKQQF